ncbi:hypothetical protein M433DRAFT_352467 [Acidomyces richmondensis BFW]|nr:MAG: hypothetical protein FE78DRAFT_517660 [Acidomyces sp. 'richmondensis']KYG49098.1 hypothetical protein M433DRAFT_352467 [Acidomyces richmondensis BFW]
MRLLVLRIVLLRFPRWRTVVVVIRTGQQNSLNYISSRNLLPTFCTTACIGRDAHGLNESCWQCRPGYLRNADFEKISQLLSMQILDQYVITSA